jgi:hypothetical protein
MFFFPVLLFDLCNKFQFLSVCISFSLKQEEDDDEDEEERKCILAMEREEKKMNNREGKQSRL